MTTSPNASTEALLAQVAEGFEALMTQYGILVKQQQEVSAQLSHAKDKHIQLLRAEDPIQEHDASSRFLDELKEIQTPSNAGPVDWLGNLESYQEDADGRTRAYRIRQGKAALESYQLRSKPECAALYTSPPQVIAGHNHERRFPKRRTPSPLPIVMEQDFTIEGTPSKLGCPFAAQRNPTPPLSSASRLSTPGRRAQRLSKGSLPDPISSATSVDGAAESKGVCPIRFLDQHSPEEVAKYFETHKHELPRSHEVCVKRFQSNADQIKALDQKYGNLVSMIQGLGHKHQEYLPEKPEDEEAIEDASKSEKVKRWAESVQGAPEPGEIAVETEAANAETEENERESRFARPLKDIRVGESPSRPWGIHVPPDVEKAPSVAVSADSMSPLLAREEMEEKRLDEAPKKCPFDHTKMAAMMGNPRSQKEAPKPVATESAPPQTQPQAQQPPQPPSMKQDVPPASSPPQQPQGAAQMVFNGPVFFGYAPEQLTTLLQQGGLFGKT